MKLLGSSDIHKKEMIRESLTNSLKSAFIEELKKEFMKVALASVDEIVEKISKEFQVFLNDKENHLNLNRAMQLEWILNKAWVDNE